MSCKAAISNSQKLLVQRHFLARVDLKWLPLALSAERGFLGGGKSMLTDILRTAAVHRPKHCWRVLRSPGKQGNSQGCGDLPCFGAEEMQKKHTTEFHFL